MITLEQAKLFCRIDNDEENELIEALIKVADDFIANACGNNYDRDNEKAELCQRILVNHWYENREIRNSNASKTLPYTIDSLLTQIRYSIKKESSDENESIKDE